MKAGKAVTVTAGAVLLLSLFGLGGGLGTGSGTGEAEPTALVEVQEATTAPVETTQEQRTAVAVTVVGGEYFYENNRIDLKELLEKLKAVEEPFFVEVTDDNASLKAYDGLLEALKEAGILYVEASLQQGV